METKMDRSQWHFRPNTQDEFIYNEVYVENCYKLPDDMSGITVIDVGANIGAFAVACLERGAERVICFEPDPDCYKTLCRHLDMFSAKRQAAYRLAVVGESRQLHPVYLSEAKIQDNILMTGGRHVNSNGEGVETDPICLRGVVLMGGVVWLKLDCEGSEHEILADNLPWDRIERIFGEIHDCGEGANADSLTDRLASVGYHVTTLFNPTDSRLSLFFAQKPVDVKQEEVKSDFCSQCGKHFSDPACGPTHALIAYEGNYVVQKTVCILTPFRNARRYLPLYFSQMASLQSLLNSSGYRMRIVAAEGDSLDGTRERIVELAHEHNIDLTLVDTTHGLMRWASVEDPIRLRAMSDVMNKALGEVRESDDIVVWIMSDLKWESQDILDLVQTAEHDETGTQDIYAPMVLTESGHFYDTWAFRWNGKRFNPSMTNPFATYQFEEEKVGLWEIDSAGTCLVMKAETALECRAYQEEAVSFCLDAKLKRHRVWLDIGVKVYHAPEPKKRLLWISDAVCISGFSRVAHALFPQLVEAGYDLTIIALNYFGEPHNFPYTIYPASVQGEDLSGNLRAKYLVYQAHKEDRPYDLIIKLDDPWNVKGLILSLDKLKSKYSVTAPTILPWATVDGENVNGDDLNYFPRVLVTSSFGSEELKKRGMWGRYSVVPFGVDTSIFHPIDKVEARSLVSSQEIPSDAFIVGVVSTNQLRKRLDLVLQYFSEWINQYQVSNAYLYLCLGPDHNSGFDINSLKDYYGLKNRIIWNPHLLSDQALALVYNSLDVYLSLSQGEGFGLPTLEAMACGVSCIVSDWAAYSSWVPESVAYKIPCTSTAVNSPVNTQSYIVGGVADQAETIGALQKLYLYPELRAKMGQAGVEFARDMSWGQTGDRLIAEIEKVISRAESSPSPMVVRAETERV